MAPWETSPIFIAIVLLLATGGVTRQPNLGVTTDTRDKWLRYQLSVQGPNVCAIEKVTDSSRRFFMPWTKGRVCGVSTEIRFECCEGFALLPEEPGCSLVKPLQNLVESVRGNGASAFAHGIIESGLQRTLSSEGPYTLFAPVNYAFLNASEELIFMLNSNSANQGGTSLLMYHVVPNRLFVDDLRDGMVIPSMYYRQPLRIHKFPSGLVTVNCVPLVAADVEATNGVLHKVETILRPPSQNSITDYVVREPLLSRLATLLVRAKMTETLRDKGAVTLFAPTDEAFAQISAEELELIANDTRAVTTLLEHHLVDHVWCSSTLLDKAETITMDGEAIKLSCNSTHKLVEDATILQGDVMASNGFIHVIDKVLMPDKVRSLKAISRTLRISQFLNYLKTAAMENLLTDNSKFTIFAPSDEAFDALSNETTQELLNNPAFAQETLMGHFVSGEFSTTNLMHLQRLKTLKRGRRLRVRLHQQRVTVDGVLLENPDHEGRNGVIHVINEVLFPPDLTIAQYLQSEPSLSAFTGALNLTSPSLLDLLETNRGPFTVFAPDNYGFSLLPPGHLERMVQEPHLLNLVMSDHIVNDLVTTSEMLRNVIYSVRTRSDRVLYMRDDDGVVSAGIAIINFGNVRCVNGIVHVVSRLIQLA